MPVNRDTYRVASAGPGPIPNRSGGDAAAMALGTVASAAGQMAARATRLMGELAQDEAVQLAKSAVINVDENGVPQAPAAEIGFMGSVARRAYDGTLDQRMGARIKAELDRGLQEDRDNNHDNLDGFLQAAQVRIDGMRPHVGERYEGMFDDAAVGIVTDISGRIGWLQAQDESRRRKQDAAVLSKQHAEQAFDLGRGGDEEGLAILMAEASNFIEAMKAVGDFDPEQAEDYRALVQASAAHGRLMAIATRENWGSVEFSQASTKLRMGEEPFDDLELTSKARIYLGQQLSTLIGEHRARERVAAKAAELNGEINDMLEGRYAGKHGDKEQKIADELMKREFGITGPEFWTNPHLSRNPKVFETLRQIGVMPTSISKVFRQWKAGTLDDAELEQVFRLGRVLVKGQAPDGGRSSLTLPADIEELIYTVDGLMEIGEFTTLRESLIVARDLRGNMDPNSLIRAVSPLVEKPETLTPDNVNSRVSTYIRDQIGDRIGHGILTVEQEKMVTALYKAMIVQADDPEFALEQVMKAVDEKNPDVQGIWVNGPVPRHWAKPSAKYALPNDPGTFARVMNWLVTGDSEESVASLGDWFVGATERDAAWIDGYIDDVVTEELAKQGIENEGLEVTYWLTPIDDDPRHPAYRVQVVNEQGLVFAGFKEDGTPFVIDPRPAYLEEKKRVQAPQEEAERRAYDEALATDRKAAKQREADRANLFRDKGPMGAMLEASRDRSRVRYTTEDYGEVDVEEIDRIRREADTREKRRRERLDGPYGPMIEGSRK